MNCFLFIYDWLIHLLDRSQLPMFTNLILANKLLKNKSMWKSSKIIVMIK
jgi:hypothetical protein